MEKPYNEGYDYNNYNNYNSYNYTSTNDNISVFFEYTLICLLLCSSWLSCYEIIKTCSSKCLKSFRIRKNVTIKKIDSDDEENLLNECSICLENYMKDDMVIILSCDHSFHESCLKEWFKNNNSCPHCRENII